MGRGGRRAATEECGVWRGATAALPGLPRQRRVSQLPRGEGSQEEEPALRGGPEVVGCAVRLRGVIFRVCAVHHKRLVGL